MLNELEFGFGHGIRILAVEDSAVFQEHIREGLGELCELTLLGDAESAAALCATTTFDMVLLDVILPGKTGLEFLPELRGIPGYTTTPVIVMTSLENIEHKRLAFEAGANDYIIKPYHVDEVRMRVKMHLELSANRRYLETQKKILEAQVSAQNDEIVRTRDASIAALAALAETRDNETGAHIHRTMKYMEIIIRAMLQNSHLAKEFDGMDPNLLVKTAPLHDIGKVGVPDSILLKPGPLDPEERATMETHAMLGFEAIDKAEQEAGKSAFLEHAKLMCRSHHEKWNGDGYPLGLSGKAIPLEGRLMAICDVYDALISRRHYKPPSTRRRPWTSCGPNGHANSTRISLMSS